MTSDSDMTNEQMRRQLSILNSEPPHVPEGFAERLWADLAIHSDSDDDSDELPDVALAAADEPNTVEVVTQLSTHDAGSPSRRWLAAVAAIAVVAAGFAIWRGADQLQSTTDVAAEGPDREPTEALADDEADAGPDTTVAPPADASNELDFAASAEIVEVGLDTVTVRFASTQDTAYNVSVRGDDGVVATSSGQVIAGEDISVVLDSLEPATGYSIDVTLIGPPTKQASLPEFRTLADPSDPLSFDVPIEILSLRHGEGDDRDVVVVETNVCALASLAVLDAENQTELGRSTANADCFTTHEFRIADLDVDLGPRTSVLVIVEVEELGPSGPSGNITTRSLLINLSE